MSAVGKPRTPDCTLELINYLVSKGKKPDSFEYGFPYIHHFRGSLKDHLKYITGPDAVSYFSSKTNQDVTRRLELIKTNVDEFLSTNPDSIGVSGIKYQRFAKQAVEQIPF